jgi:hypothetical protein
MNRRHLSLSETAAARAIMPEPWSVSLTNCTVLSQVAFITDFGRTLWPQAKDADADRRQQLDDARESPARG